MIPTTNDVRADIQMRIARFLEDTPERSLLLIPFDELEGFARLSPEGQATIITQLGGYPGVPMDTPELHIPKPYIIHPMVGSRQMEVIIKQDGFEDSPETVFAEEVAMLASEASEETEGEDTFSLALPPAILELRDEMKPEERRAFRTLIKERLTTYGLALKYDRLTTVLKIRRTK